MSIYIYCWAYDYDTHMPVKEEFEIHDFATDKSFNELENEDWLIALMEEIEERHIRLHPNTDRYPYAQIGYDNVTPTFKPPTKQTTLYEYTLFTKWQRQEDTKFRNYVKRNESQRSIKC